MKLSDLGLEIFTASLILVLAAYPFVITFYNYKGEKEDVVNADF